MILIAILWLISSVSLIALYITAIKKLPSSLTFTVSLPILNGEDYGAFCRNCLLDSTRATAFANSVMNPGTANLADEVPRRETDDVYQTTTIRVERLSSNPVQVFANVTLKPDRLTSPAPKYYEAFVKEMLIPATACQHRKREQLRLVRILERATEDEISGLRGFYLPQKDKEKLPLRTTQDKPKILSFIDQNVDLSSKLQAALTVDDSKVGTFSIEELLAELPQGSWGHDLLAIAKSNITRASQSTRLVSESLLQAPPPLTVTDHSVPKLRNLAVICAVSLIAAVFVSLSVHLITIEIKGKKRH